MSNGFCTQCGHPLDAAEQHFCPACGAPLVAHTPPEPGPQTVDSVPATEDLAGRNCPYCRFPLKAGGAVHHCPSCHAVHHTECWQENGGCAIASCAAGPSSSDATQIMAAAAPMPATTAAAAPAAAAVPPAPGTGRAMPPGGAVPPPPLIASATVRRVSLGALAIVAALVIALGGSATALVLSTKHTNSADQQTSAQSSGEDTSTADDTTTDDPSYDGTTSDDGSSTDDDPSTNESPVPDTNTESEPDRQPSSPPSSPTLSPKTKVERAVKRHWRYIESGDYYAAFDLLSPSLQSSSGGAANWVAEHVKDHLVSVGVEVSAHDVTSTTAIADVITLRTDARATGCKDWSGHYEMVKSGGRWKIAKSKLSPSSC